jgi:GDP-mannose 6-dehydrogenase
VTYQGRLLDVQTPVLSAILASNRVQIDHALSMIHAAGSRRVGILGLGFKEGTDDLRESAIVTLAERLIGKGYELRIFDRNVQLASLLGANKEYILNHIPHIGRLLVEQPAKLFDECDVVVVASAEEEFAGLVRTHGREKRVIDLVGKWDLASASATSDTMGYDGIAW